MDMHPRPNSLAPALHRFREWIPVLMLHEVVPDGTDPVPPYGITRSRLREILSDFTDRGYRSGALNDVIRRFDESHNVGAQDSRNKRDKQLVLSFDDGTRDFLDNALPVLQEFHFSAALFIVTGMIGQKRVWEIPSGMPALAPVPLMGADELLELHRMGFTIGSHTVSHRSLPSLSTKDAREEIALSRQTLNRVLGSPVQWFAYPFLEANDRTRKLVREAGYEGACGGPNQELSRYYLSRIDASLYTIPQLRLRCNGLFQMTRLAVRRMRYFRLQTPVL